MEGVIIKRALASYHSRFIPDEPYFVQFLTVIDPLHPLMIQSKIRCRWPLTTETVPNQLWSEFYTWNTCTPFHLIFEPTCATCMVGSYASLCICLSVCLSVHLCVAKILDFIQSTVFTHIIMGNLRFIAPNKKLGKCVNFFTVAWY